MTGGGFKRGERVRKKSGYAFHGVVVSAFEKLDGQTRYVVECTVHGCEGMLHIFRAEQLECMPMPESGYRIWNIGMKMKCRLVR